MSRSFFTFSVVRADPSNLTTGGDSILTALKDVSWEVKEVVPPSNSLGTATIFDDLSATEPIQGAAGVTGNNGLIEFWAEPGLYSVKVTDPKARIATKYIYWDSVSGQMSGIPGDRITTETITTDQIKNSEVKTADIATSAVTTAKLADLNVTTAKLAASGVTSDKLANNAVITGKIQNGTIVADDVNSLHKDGTASTPSMRTLGTGATQAAAGNDSRLSNSRTPTGAAGGALRGTYPDPTLDSIPHAMLRRYGGADLLTYNQFYNYSGGSDGSYTDSAFDNGVYHTGTALANLSNGRIYLRKVGIWLINASCVWDANGEGWRMLSIRHSSKYPYAVAEDVNSKGFGGLLAFMQSTAGIVHIPPNTSLSTYITAQVYHNASNYNISTGQYDAQNLYLYELNLEATWLGEWY